MNLKICIDSCVDMKYMVLGYKLTILKHIILLNDPFPS